MKPRRNFDGVCFRSHSTPKPLSSNTNTVNISICIYLKSNWKVSLWDLFICQFTRKHSVCARMNHRIGMKCQQSTKHSVIYNDMRLDCRRWIVFFGGGALCAGISEISKRKYSRALKHVLFIEWVVLPARVVDMCACVCVIKPRMLVIKCD